MIAECPRKGLAVVKNVIISSNACYVFLLQDQNLESACGHRSFHHSHHALLFGQQIRLPEFTIIFWPCVAPKRKPPRILVKTKAWRHFKGESQGLLWCRDHEVWYHLTRLESPETVLVIWAFVEFPHQPAQVIVITTLKTKSSQPNEKTPKLWY